MVLFRITENEPSKMHNVRPYVYSRPWFVLFAMKTKLKMMNMSNLKRVLIGTDRY